MGVEQHAYGTVLCLTRRRFVQASCLVIALVYFAHLSSAFLRLVFQSASDVDKSCTGTECYDVWTCRGMRDSTQHMRSPMLLLLGFAAALIGAYGGTHGLTWNCNTGGRGLILLGAACFVLILLDILYTHSCSAYPTNVIQSTFMGPFNQYLVGVPASRDLRDMSDYPIESVSKATGGFYILVWYVLMACAWGGFVLFVGLETRFLGSLVERGPLGLGVSYGLNQWDQIIDHEVVGIINRKMQPSQFIDDAQLPPPINGGGARPEHLVSGGEPGGDYGAMKAKAKMQAAMPMPHLSADRQRWETISRGPGFTSSGYA